MNTSKVKVTVTPQELDVLLKVTRTMVFAGSLGPKIGIADPSGLSPEDWNQQGRDALDKIEALPEDAREVEVEVYGEPTLYLVGLISRHAKLPDEARQVVLSLEEKIEAAVKGVKVFTA